MSLRHMLLGGLSALSLSLGAVGAANAQSDWLDAYRGALEAAHTLDAIGLAEAQVALSPNDRQAHFALGTAKFFGAVEGFGQNMYRHGLKSGTNSTGMMPFFRLPIDENPSPEPVTYQKLRESLRKFVGALEAAEAELGKVGPGPTVLTLDLNAVALDLDVSGTGDTDESLLPLLREVMGLRGSPADVPPLVVDFDESDVLWLRAYCHLIAAMGDFLLGYDWEQGYDTAFFAVFPSGEFPNSPIVDEFRSYGQTPDFGQPYNGIVELIAFIHTMHWPVEDKDRLASVHSHLKSMVELSRQNMQSVQAETDSGREWIPNLTQNGVLPGMEIDKDLLEGWSLMLEKFDGILDGELLIPHWRFQGGINFKRFLLEPTDFDIVLLLQGSTAVRYLEKGSVIDGGTWTRISTLMRGDFMRYFLWIN